MSNTTFIAEGARVHSQRGEAVEADGTGATGAKRAVVIAKANAVEGEPAKAHAVAGVAVAAVAVAVPDGAAAVAAAGLGAVADADVVGAAAAEPAAVAGGCELHGLCEI